MQTTRRETDSFVSRKSFKYNDVIDSKIVNLDIWHNFRFLDESSWELKSSINSKSISGWIRMLKPSIWVESEDWYQVLKSSQKINIETRLDDQSISQVSKSDHQQISSTIRSAATILSKIWENSLISREKSSKFSLKQYLQLASNDRSQSSRLHDFKALVF